MGLNIRCSCGVVLQVSSDLAGKKIRCRQCQKVIVINLPDEGISSAPEHQQVSSYRSPLANRSTQPLSTSNGWKKQTAGANKQLIVGVWIASGVLGLALIFVVVAKYVPSLSGSKLDDSSTAAVERSSVLPTPPPTPTPTLSQAPSPPTIESKPAIALTSTPQSTDVKPALANGSTDANKDAKPPSTPLENSVGTTLEPMNLVDLIERVEPSVVRIDVKSGKEESIGSGVFVDSAGLVVTNYHVVQGASSVVLMTRDGQKFTSNGFLHVDPLKDLAVISIPPGSLDISPIPIARSLPRKGQEVAAFGSPMGFSFSATQGTVSSIRSGSEIREVLTSLAGIDVYSILGYSAKTNWIQMTAAISGGNSGGPLVNMSGELVGINTFTSPAGQNLNFAATFEEVISVLEVAKTSKLKTFSELPQQRITIEFPGGPPDNDRDLASNAADSSSPNRPGRNGSEHIGPPGSTPPGSTPPEGVPPGTVPPGSVTWGISSSGDGSSRSFSTGNGSSENFSSEEGPNGSFSSRGGRSGGTATIVAPRVLTPEETEELRLRETGTMSIVNPTESETFSVGKEANVVRSFSTGDAAVVHLSISPDEKYLAATTFDGSLNVFDNEKNGQLLYTIETQHKLIRRSAFTSSPTRLVTGRDAGTEKNIHFRDPQSGEILVGLKDIFPFKMVALAVSSDGRSVFSRCGNDMAGPAWFWRFGILDDNPQRIMVQSRVLRLNSSYFGEDACGKCAVFSPDNRILWVGGEDGLIASLTGAGNEIGVSGIKRIGSGPILDIAILPDGNTLLTGGEDGQARLVQVSEKNWSPTKLGTVCNGEVLGVCVSTSGTLAATTAADKKINIYEIEGRLLKQTILVPSVCLSIRFFNHDKYLLAGCKDGQIRVYRVD